MATSLSRMVKKAASSVIPLLANRSRNYKSSIFTTPLKSSNLSRQIPTHHHFSSLANKRSDSDDTLLDIIDSEIGCAKEEFDDLEVAEVPREFPFKIVDNAGNQTITLIREYQDELIKVTVHMPDDNASEEEKVQCVDLVVSVSKKTGPSLEFAVTSQADGIIIYSLAVKNPNASDEDMPYQGPEFETLDGNMFSTHIWKTEGLNPALPNSYMTTWLAKRSRNTLGG